MQRITISVLKETARGERRVALTPEVVKKLISQGFTVWVEGGAGKAAYFHDAHYSHAGAHVVSAQVAWEAPVVVKVNPPTLQEISALRPNSVLISFIFPAQNPDLLQQLSAKNLTVFAMDAVPRISRAQTVDALSAMGQLLGYRAIIEAAGRLGRVLPGQITATGKSSPAHALVLGAGVAGLAAISTARSLGATVSAADIRVEAREQIESLGAAWVPLSTIAAGPEEAPARSALGKAVGTADIVVLSAVASGSKAPVLVTAEMVARMRPGSVIVDLAAGQGGNCALTVSGTVTESAHGVQILGDVSLSAALPVQASQCYAATLFALLKQLHPYWSGEVLHEVYREDAVLDAMAITADGILYWKPVVRPLEAREAPTECDPAEIASSGSVSTVRERSPCSPEFRGTTAVQALPTAAILTVIKAIFWGIGILLGGALLVNHPLSEPFFSECTFFLLASFLGYALVWQVPHALHTPLMSLTNAISGIIVLGALVPQGLAASTRGPLPGGGWYTSLAIFFASINLLGGFAMTHRMLQLFRLGGKK